MMKHRLNRDKLVKTAILFILVSAITICFVGVDSFIYDVLYWRDTISVNEDTYEVESHDVFVKGLELEKEIEFRKEGYLYYKLVFTGLSDKLIHLLKNRKIQTTEYYGVYRVHTKNKEEVFVWVFHDSLLVLEKKDGSDKEFNQMVGYLAKKYEPTHELKEALF
ncbi:MAG: hypothetical protein KKD39_02630 [Candidatus Altiarchaeota archaeon]|nr:hypothetical protein [Candidatus Altiarchaeota archaeon]